MSLCRLRRALCAWAACAAPLLWAADYEARAVIKSVDRAVLSGELAAKVERLPFRAGERFEQGATLAVLECDLYEAQQEKVAAEHDAAQVKLENTRRLSELRSIGALELTLAESALRQSRAELEIAALNTRRCSISAPWDGRVVQLLVNEHENIRPQQQLLEIVRDGQLEAEIVVPSNWLAWVEPGAAVALRIDETGAVENAAVTAVTPAIDAVSQTVVLRATLPAGAALIPGMSASASFPERTVSSSAPGIEGWVGSIGP